MGFLGANVLMNTSRQQLIFDNRRFRAYRAGTYIRIAQGANWEYNHINSLGADKLDFYRAMLHEIGHVLGLSHSYVNVQQLPAPVSEFYDIMYGPTVSFSNVVAAADRIKLSSSYGYNAKIGSDKVVQISKKQKWQILGYEETTTLLSSCISPLKIKLCTVDTIISVQNTKVGNTYQWQISLDDGVNDAVPLATQIGNATTVSAKLKKGFIKNGAKVRCVVTNGALKDTTLYTVIYTNGLPSIKPLPPIARTAPPFNINPFSYPKGGFFKVIEPTICNGCLVGSTGAYLVPSKIPANVNRIKIRYYLKNPCALDTLQSDTTGMSIALGSLNINPNRIILPPDGIQKYVTAIGIDSSITTTYSWERSVNKGVT